MPTFTVNTHHAYLNNDIVMKSNGQITIKDTATGKQYEFQDKLKTRLSAGHHILKCEDHEEEIMIEDAIKLGGSTIKASYVFDNNPWIFVVTKDRLYITDKEGNVENVEYAITPDEIICLPKYFCNRPNEYFLFKTNNDFAIFNAIKGKIVFQFTNHIFSNGHLVIFSQDDGIEVYDFRIGKTVVHFDGQFSFGKRFYFVKDSELHGLDLTLSCIGKISYVGKVNDTDLLLNNHLLRLNSDYKYEKVYSYFSLGDGYTETSMSETKIVSPYYIESWDGEITPHFEKVQEEYRQFNKIRKQSLPSFPNIHSLCIGIRIKSETYHKNSDSTTIELHGEVVSFPKIASTNFFKVEGIVGEKINFTEHTFELPKKNDKTQSHNSEKISFPLEKGEKVIGTSPSGNLVIIQDGEGLYLYNIKKNNKNRILRNVFDTSKYSNAYFTGDGRNVFLRENNDEIKLFGLDNLSTKSFEIDGFTIARNEGYNGYMPEILTLSGRKPVWRDPITLERISESEMSSHIFKSPNGEYMAAPQMKTIIYNRLTKSEITEDETIELKSKYNWYNDTPEEEKKSKIELRRDIANRCDKFDLFGKIIEKSELMFHNNEDEQEREDRRSKYIEDEIERYITQETDFVSLFVDILGYVCYRKNVEDAEEKRILIGRNVFYLNYVSFSYDSKYLSFAAKMKEDEFRFSQEGVFEIFDLEKEEIVRRIENINDRQLWAVWMTIFSKNGDVAFYDSCANAYLVRKSDKYKITEKAPGKSLLCFSPSGKFIALSDQNYIDFTHHPYENWGHQPSGNVFIHSVDKFNECMEQYNDMGDGISGVATRRGNVSSAAFSQDETKLLMVGKDGVVVVRNLIMTKKDDGNYDTEYTDTDSYGINYREYAGTYAQDIAGYSDDVINDAFDGEPDAYWNID